MKHENLDPELEQLVKKLKLKEPSEDVMGNYLSGINARINEQIEQSHFGFPQFATVMAISLVLVGAVYFIYTSYIKPVKNVEAIPNSQITSASSGTLPRNDAKPLSLEEEMTVIEAFAEESSKDMIELFGEDAVLEELAQMDESELSSPTAPNPAQA